MKQSPKKNVRGERLYALFFIHFNPATYPTHGWMGRQTSEKCSLCTSLLLEVTNMISIKFSKEYAQKMNLDNNGRTNTQQNANERSYTVTGSCH